MTRCFCHSETPRQPGQGNDVTDKCSIGRAWSFEGAGRTLTPAQAKERAS